MNNGIFDPCALNDRIKQLQQQLYDLAAIVAKQQIPAIKQTYIAGTVINGGKAVIVDVDKRIYPFDISNPYHYDKYLGIAEGGGSFMDQIVVVTQGVSKVIGTGWHPGMGYYIGGNSFLTSIPPLIGMVKQVAVGVDDNTIIVNNEVEAIAI